MQTITRNSFQSLTSSETNEWYTPAWVFDYVRRLGDIGLDPASNEIAQAWIKAEKYYTQADNGLTRSWETKKLLWLNPPYGKKNYSLGVYGANAWIERAIDGYRQGLYPHACLLVRGDSKAVKTLEAEAISCEPKDRIEFIDPFNPERKNPVPGCRFWYLGDWEKFNEVFKEVGAIRTPFFDITSA